MLSGDDGLVCNFEIHTRKINPWANHPDIDVSRNIALTLLKHTERNKDQKLFIANWSTSIPLLKILMNQGIGVVGTVRSNHLKNRKMPSYKYMWQNKRGSFAMKIALVDNIELCTMKWIDHWSVIVLTSYETPQPLSKVKG